MFTSLLSHLNWLHVLVAALAYFSLGAIWYNQKVFGSIWVKGHGIDMNNADAKKGMAGVMIGSLLFMLLQTIGVAILQQLIPGYSLDIIHAIKFGVFIGIVFSVSAISIGYLYNKKPLSVHLIDGVYQVVGIVIVSVVMALWK